MKQYFVYGESVGCEMGVKQRTWKKIFITAFQNSYRGIHFIFISSSETRGPIVSVCEVCISMYWLSNTQTDGKRFLRTKIFRAYEEINMKIIVFTKCILSKSHVNMCKI